MPTTYIDCEPPDAENWLHRQFAKLAQSRGSGYCSLPVGHDAQVIAPEALVEVLIEATAG